MDSKLDDAIEAALEVAEPNVVMMTGGMLIVEVMVKDDPDPQLKVMTLGEPTAWAMRGMLESAVRLSDSELDRLWRPDVLDDDD